MALKINKRAEELNYVISIEYKTCPTPTQRDRI